MNYNDKPNEEIERFVHRKGLFWIIPREDEGDGAIVYAADCDKNGIADENAPPYNSKNGKSYAHKNSWLLACGGNIDKPWNYYPRGRVEIANGKATVYHNPILTDRPLFEQFIKSYFKLKDLPVRFIPDHSKHYESELTDAKPD